MKSLALRSSVWKGEHFFGYNEIGLEYEVLRVKPGPSYFSLAGFSVQACSRANSSRFGASNPSG